MSLRWVWLSYLWKTSSGIVGSRGPERPASEELLSRVAPPSGGPFQQAECHAGATAPRSAGPEVCFFAIRGVSEISFAIVFVVIYQRQSYRRSRDRRSLADMACSWDSHDRTGTGVTSVHQRLTCRWTNPLSPPLPVGSVSPDPPPPYPPSLPPPGSYVVK